METGVSSLQPAQAVRHRMDAACGLNRKQETCWALRRRGEPEISSTIRPDDLAAGCRFAPVPAPAMLKSHRRSRYPRRTPRVC
jgi:hypothetical protein